MQLAIPIFNGFRNNKKIISSKIESQKSKLVIEQEMQELEKQVTLEEKNKKKLFATGRKIKRKTTIC